MNLDYVVEIFFHFDIKDVFFLFISVKKKPQQIPFD